LEGLEALGEVVGVDEVAQVGSQLVMGFVEVSFDGCVLFMRSTCPLSGMRSSAPRCPAVSRREPAIW
jgi:hypothetical protein